MLGTGERTKDGSLIARNVAIIEDACKTKCADEIKSIAGLAMVSPSHRYGRTYRNVQGKPDSRRSEPGERLAKRTKVG